MGRPFTWIFRFFRRFPVFFYLTLAGIILYCVIGISRLQWNNDVFSIFPLHASSADYTAQVANMRANNDIMVLLHTESPSDSSLRVLVDNAEWWEHSVNSSSYLSSVIPDAAFRMTDSLQRVLYDSVFFSLPLLLNGDDLDTVRQRLDNAAIERIVARNNRLNSGFSGFAMRHFNQLDPLHLAPIVLKKLETFQTVPGLKQANGFQVSKDERNLFFNFNAIYKDKEDPGYRALNDSLTAMRQVSEKLFPGVKTYLFGAPIASEINKERSFRDGNLTGSLSILLTLGLLYYFFRRKRITMMVLLPSVVGYGMALATFGFAGVPIVAMAMSSATIILAMGINYSVHLVNARLHSDNIEDAIREIVNPMITGNVTTVAAFALLIMSDSLLLQQFGILASISLAAGVLTALMVLPQWLVHTNTTKAEVSIPWFGRLANYEFHKNKWIIGLVIIGSIAMFFPASRVQFRGDLTDLNYIPREDRAGYNILENDLGFNLSRTNIRVNAPVPDSALALYNEARRDLLQIDSTALIPDLSAIQPTATEQYNNQAGWSELWADSLLSEKKFFAASLHGGQDVVRFLDRVKTFDTIAVPERLTEEFSRTILSKFMKNEADGSVSLNVPVTGHFDLGNQDSDKPYHLFNGRYFATQTAKYLQQDFNNILAYSAIIVFLLLFLVYGRLELAILAFIPMTLSWFWILGIAYLVGIQIHIVNLILCTFIFGLCDDYSIFMIDGLTKEYATGKKVINKDKKVIIISVMVTMIGLGALLAGRHPAFHSFAILALIGLAVVLILSLTIQPALYHYFVTYRTNKGNAPVTILSFCVSIITFSTFIALGLILSIVGMILKWTGLMRLAFIRYTFHLLVRISCHFVIWITPTAHHVKEDMHYIDWKKPGIIIANHQTHIDLLIMIGLHTKIVVLTNEWVYNNPVYGGLVRAAGYLPGFSGMEHLLEQARKQIDLGYFIVIFPEGTRSESGEIKRFHKGAFFLAEQLNVPIYPVLLHGLNLGLTKGDQNIKKWSSVIRALPAVAPNDGRFSPEYSLRGKEINHWMRREFEKIKEEKEVPSYYFDTLRKNYLYKGPVLYWYAKIKMLGEKLYSHLHELIPRQATILDLGCGYGMMDYMLAMCSSGRAITGVDYDEEKVAVAANNFYAKRLNIRFESGDIRHYAITNYDVFLLYDSLHYLKKEEQTALLDKCAQCLNPGGMIIIREGVSGSDKRRHFNTRLTERFSTKILRFNKTTGSLKFIDEEDLYELARRFNFTVEKRKDSRISSNTLFIIRNQRPV